jgi:hypothetical protein
MLQTLLMGASLPPLGSVSCLRQHPLWTSATACCRGSSHEAHGVVGVVASGAVVVLIMGAGTGETGDDLDVLLMLLLAA